MNFGNQNFAKLTKAKTVMVIGGTRRGKTSLVFRFLEVSRETDKRPIYVYKHPKPNLIKELGFHIMHSLEEVTEIQNAIVYVDEPQLVMPREDKKNNVVLQRIMSLAGQRNILLIFSTSDSRWVNRGLESYVDLWLVKDIDYDTLKQGSKVRKIIKRNSTIDPAAKRLKINEFLLDGRDFIEFSGKHTYLEAGFFNLALSKPFLETAEETAVKPAEPLIQE